MSVKFNKMLLLWCTGVLQPVSAKEIKTFMDKMYPDASQTITVVEIESYLKTWLNARVITLVHKTPCYFYSLTQRGNLLFSKDLRYNRDKTRLFLLKESCKIARNKSGGYKQKLAGVSPAVNDSQPKQKRCPKTLDTASGLQSYWSPLSKQLFAGSEDASPDLFLDLYSYPSWEEIKNSGSIIDSRKDSTITNLALAIGISPKLVGYMIRKPSDHYRSFEIGKRGGGKRNIDSPKVFLKTVQYWIADYLLYKLKIHQKCFSYQKNKSIIQNAKIHEQQQYVANIDIKDFFGSITTERIKNLLVDNAFEDDLAQTIAKLTTYQNKLPQGAPTSTILSNAFLCKFDENVDQLSKKENLIYSRYADDITISGSNKREIFKIITKCEKALIIHGLSLKDEKTRIASNRAQQKVTGIIVNDKSKPPREKLKIIRSIFDHAKKNPKNFENRSNELKGYIGYLNMFPSIKAKGILDKYYNIVNNSQKS